MLRTVALDHAYIEALARLVPEPQVADEWQRMQVERVLAQETVFDGDVYQTHRSGDSVWRVFITEKTAELPRMLVFFTLEKNDAIHLQALAVLPIYEAPPLAPAQQALAF